MSSAATVPLVRQPSLPVSVTRLLLGVLGPAIAWALHIGLVYPLVLLACELGTNAPLYVVTAATALLSLAFGFSSWRALRRLPPPEQGHDEPMLSQARFLARTGVWSSVLFLVVILAESVPIVIEHPCA